MSELDRLARELVKQMMGRDVDDVQNEYYQIAYHYLYKAMKLRGQSEVNQRELLLDFADYSERDKTSQTTDECVDNYLDSIL